MITFLIALATLMIGYKLGCKHERSRISDGRAFPCFEDWIKKQKAGIHLHIQLVMNLENKKLITVRIFKLSAGRLKFYSGILLTAKFGSQTENGKYETTGDPKDPLVAL